MVTMIPNFIRPTRKERTRSVTINAAKTIFTANSTIAPRKNRTPLMIRYLGLELKGSGLTNRSIKINSAKPTYRLR